MLSVKNQLLLTTALDSVNSQMVHFRLESPNMNWISIGIGASPNDGMTGGDMWPVYLNPQNNVWTIEVCV